MMFTDEDVEAAAQAICDVSSGELPIGEAWDHSPEHVREGYRVAAHAALSGLEAGRQVTTRGELDLLPLGWVIRSEAGTIACRYNANLGVVFGNDLPVPWGFLKLPATILHRGEQP